MNRRQVASWCLFDFANSSYSAVIAAVVFQVFYINRIVGNEDGRGDLWWGRAISASMLFVSLSSPFLGGIADYAGLRKRLLGAYTALVRHRRRRLALLSPGAAVAGFALIVLANVGMEGGLVFYNSFLPQIAPPERQGRVSGWGFGVGYAGSIVSLLIALPLAKAGRFEPIWLMVASFFALFSLPAFRFLPRDERSRIGAPRPAAAASATPGRPCGRSGAAPEPRTFLLAYMIYEDGVNTVIIFSSSLAATTFGFAQGELIALYLVVQVTALAGAFALSKPTDTWGPKRVVCISLLLWAVVAVAAFFVQGKAAFWARGLHGGPRPRLGAGRDPGLLHAVHPAGQGGRVLRRLLPGREDLGDLRPAGLRLALGGLRQPAPGDPLDRALLRGRARAARPREGRRAERRKDREHVG